MAVVFSIFILSSILWYISVFSMTSDCNGGACAPFTTAEKIKLLDIHNELRDRTAGGGLLQYGHPSATDMNSLIWDDGLAEVAQAYAEKCEYEPNGQASVEYLAKRNENGTKWGDSNPANCQGCISIGENISALKGSPFTINNALSFIESWYDEWRQWTYGVTGSRCSGVCGHYTQIVSARTRYVGCGYANGCNMDIGGSSGWTSLFVCHYFPPGNIGGTLPYTAGSPCTDCMSDRPVCSSNYVSVSSNAHNYPSQPYNALCNGGACPTMCDGTGKCNGIGCTTNTIDCNDGTTSKTSGRDICDYTNSPTIDTNAPIPSPTHSPNFGTITGGVRYRDGDTITDGDILRVTASGFDCVTGNDGYTVSFMVGVDKAFHFSVRAWSGQIYENTFQNGWYTTQATVMSTVGISRNKNDAIDLRFKYTNTKWEVSSFGIYIASLDFIHRISGSITSILLSPCLHNPVIVMEKGV